MPVWELEEVLAHPVPLRVSVTVSLGQFHDAGYDIAGVVVQRLGCTERKVGQGNGAIDRVTIGYRLGDCHRHGRRAGAAASDDGDQATGPPLVGRFSEWLDRAGIADRRGRDAQRVGEVVAPEVVGQKRCGAELEPVAINPGIVDDQRRCAGVPRRRDQIAVRPLRCAIDEQCGVGPTGRQAGPHLGRREALDELDRGQSRSRPARDLGKPGRTGRRQPQHHPALSHGRTRCSLRSLGLVWVRRASSCPMRWRRRWRPGPARRPPRS